MVSLDSARVWTSVNFIGWFGRRGIVGPTAEKLRVRRNQGGVHDWLLDCSAPQAFCTSRHPIASVPALQQHSCKEEAGLSLGARAPF